MQKFNGGCVAFVFTAYFFFLPNFCLWFFSHAGLDQATANHLNWCINACSGIEKTLNPEPWPRLASERGSYWWTDRGWKGETHADIKREGERLVKRGREQLGAKKRKVEMVWQFSPRIRSHRFKMKVSGLNRPISETIMKISSQRQDFFVICLFICCDDDDNDDELSPHAPPISATRTSENRRKRRLHIFLPFGGLFVYSLSCWFDSNMPVLHQ